MPLSSRAGKIRHESFSRGGIHSFAPRGTTIALVCADTVEWPRLMDLTSDLRLLCGCTARKFLYVSGYEDVEHRCLGVPASWAWATGKRSPSDAERRHSQTFREAEKGTGRLRVFRQ